MNTEITYEYRDGANYRFHTSVVVAGEMTPKLWARIRATLDEDVEGGFIADQVGLPQAFGYLGGSHIYSDEQKDSGYDYDEEIDHCWHRFADDDQLSVKVTAREPTDKRTVEQLAAAFEAAAKAGWRIFDPADRFGL